MPKSDTFFFFYMSAGRINIPPDCPSNQIQSVWKHRACFHKQCFCTDALRVDSSARQPGTRCVFSILQSSALRDSNWQAALCFCLRHAMPVCHSRFLSPAVPSANHGVAQVDTEARQGGVHSELTQTEWKRSSRETC